jgi:hypothetical protein
MTPRTLAAALLVATSFIVAACSSTGGPTSSVGKPTPSSSPPVLPVPVSGEFGVGTNRVVFSLLDPTGTKPAAAPDRHLAVGYLGPSGETIASSPLTFIWAIEGLSGVYIGHADFPSAGKWTATFTTSAPGSPELTLPFTFDVEAKTHVLRPGGPAPSVRTPTLADVGGDVSKVSSDVTPVKRFYETSEAAALAAKKPFVLIFATPKFCQSATCGPTLDRLKPVAAAHPEMTFINVEPYKLQDVAGELQPVLDASNQLQPVEATVAFGLQTEPFVFVVGADGKIASSFELVFSPDEIEAAIKAVEQG